MPNEQSNRVLGAVMAGGESTRMGAPKPSATLAGRPLISYPLAALATAGIEAVVVAKEGTPLPPLDIPVWQEPDQPVHPLRGIVTALERAGGRPLVVCGCDTPLVSAELVMHLANTQAAVVLPRAGGRLHPLLARYESTVAEQLSAALADERSIHEAIAALDPLVIEEQELRRFGDPERLLFNVNTPADLARAEELLAQRDAS